MLKKILTILLIFIISNNVFSQKAKISGNVINFDNKPIDFVSVALQNSTIGTYTNAKGNYMISVPMGDSITIKFSALGYQQKEYVIPKVSGDMHVNIMLRDKEEELETVVIVGEKKNTTTMDKIDLSKSQLMVNPSGNGVEALVMSQPGVRGSSELSSQYSVRGGNYDENIVYVNGIEIYRPLLIRAGQQEGLSFINPNMAGAVEFSSGGYEVMYGDRMSSVLDISYKRPKSFEASVGASLLGANVYVGSAYKRFTQITGFRYKTAQSLLGTLDTKAEYNPSFIDVQTYLTFTLSQNWMLSFLGNHASNTYKFTPQSRETRFGTLRDSRNFRVYFDGWEHDQFTTSFGAFTLKGKITDKLEVGIMASAFSSNERERYDIGGEYELTDLNLESNGGNGENGNFLGIGTYHEHARNSLNTQVMNINHFGAFKLDKNLIKWGVTLQREKIDNMIKEWEMRDSAGFSLPNDGIKVNVYSHLRARNETNTTRYSAYLQDAYKIFIQDKMIALNVGVRGSYCSFNKEFIFSPRASIAYIPNGSKDITLRFATGVYYQAPFFREYQQIVQQGNDATIKLNENIKSQKSIHFVLGSDYVFKTMDRKFKWTSELYYKKLSDLVPYTIDNVKIRYYGENIASGYIVGFDTKLFGEFVPGTDSWISFSLMKTQQDIRGTKLPLPTDQLYNVSIFFQDYFPGQDRLKMNLIGHLSQGLPVAAPHSTFGENYFRTPSYRRVDIGFLWQLLGEDFDIRHRSSFAKSFKNVWVGLDVFNLFNIKNTNSYYWVTDIFNQQYAVPNYLTERVLNIKIVANF